MTDILQMKKESLVPDTVKQGPTARQEHGAQMWMAVLKTKKKQLFNHCKTTPANDQFIYIKCNLVIPMGHAMSEMLWEMNPPKMVKDHCSSPHSP